MGVFGPFPCQLRQALLRCVAREIGSSFLASVVVPFLTFTWLELWKKFLCKMITLGMSFWYAETSTQCIQICLYSEDTDLSYFLYFLLESFIPLVEVFWFSFMVWGKGAVSGVRCDRGRVFLLQVCCGVFHLNCHWQELLCDDLGQHCSDSDASCEWHL